MHNPQNGGCHLNNPCDKKDELHEVFGHDLGCECRCRPVMLSDVQKKVREDYLKNVGGYFK